MSNGGIGLAGRPTGFDLVETIEQLAKFPCAARIESGAARREVVAKRLGLLGDELVDFRKDLVSLAIHAASAVRDVTRNCDVRHSMARRGSRTKQANSWK